MEHTQKTTQSKENAPQGQFTQQDEVVTEGNSHARPRNFLNPRNVLNLQRVIGNASVQRLIQRAPAKPEEKPVSASAPVVQPAPVQDSVPAQDVAPQPQAQTVAPPVEVKKVEPPSIKQQLINGDYAYQGYYEADDAGQFIKFDLPELEQAKDYYVQWAGRTTSSAPEKSEWDIIMERARAAEAAKLEERRKQQAETRARLREHREKTAAGNLRNSINNALTRKEKTSALYDKKIAEAESIKREDTRDAKIKGLQEQKRGQLAIIKVNGLPKDPEAYRRMQAEDSGKLEQYQAMRSQIELNAAIYQELRSKKLEIQNKRETLEGLRETLPAQIETSKKEAEDAKKAYQAAVTAFVESQKKLPANLKKNTTPELVALDRTKKSKVATAEGNVRQFASIPAELEKLFIDEFQTRSTIINIAKELDEPYRQLGIEGRYTNTDPRKIANPAEREAAVKKDPYLSKDLDIPGRFVESGEIEEDKAWIAKALAEEAARKEKDQQVMQDSETETDTDSAPAAEEGTDEASPARVSASELQAQVEKTDYHKVYEQLKAQTEMDVTHKEAVVAGDTAGHAIVEHPQWFNTLLKKLMGLSPADPIKPIQTKGQVWDSEADAAQAVMTAYLNAWTKRRLAIVHGSKDAAGKDEKIPTNIEVMNAAVGFSETNERAELYSGLRGEMDWCGPGTQRSIILGLWKAGLYLRTSGKPNILNHMSEIPTILEQIKTLDGEISPLQAKAQELAQKLQQVAQQLNEKQESQKAAGADKKAIGAEIAALNKKAQELRELAKANKTLLDQKKMKRKMLWWKLWDWAKRDLTLQDSSMIDKWFGEGQKKPAGNQTGAQVDTRRQIDLPEAATAPLYPGDFVYWTSSFAYGPIAGHVATIIEEKDRDNKVTAAQTNEHVSDLRIDSANAGGARPGEGAVRPEQTERVVTDTNFDYWSAAGDSNKYYYGQDPSVSRDGYNTLYNAAAKKQAEAKKSDPNAPAGDPANDPTVKPMGDRIAKYKGSTTFPVHKTPQTPADNIPPSNRYQTEKKKVGPTKDNAVWIVSIKRTSTLLDPLKMTEKGGAYNTLNGDSDNFDLGKLDERRLAVMPPGMKELIVEIFTVGGLLRLLRGETFNIDYAAHKHLDSEDQGTVSGKK